MRRPHQATIIGKNLAEIEHSFFHAVACRHQVGDGVGTLRTERGRLIIEAALQSNL
jgi:hypothetical protein